jgi:hypothetical protein
MTIFGADSIPGSSTTVSAGRRGILQLPSRRWHGPVGDAGFIGQRDRLMVGCEASSA